jgi:hypothetical protein
MKVRPAHETLESLRLTLLKVEQTAEPDQDIEALADLKRILLQRIAELEAVHAIEVQAIEVRALESAAALQSAPGQTEDKPNPADLVPPSVTAAESKDVAADAELASTPPPETDA